MSVRGCGFKFEVTSCYATNPLVLGCATVRVMERVGAIHAMNGVVYPNWTLPHPTPPNPTLPYPTLPYPTLGRHLSDLTKDEGMKMTAMAVEAVTAGLEEVA